ncbi:hypothetical protein J5U21_01792 [Saccharolobus shibatae]|uniref:HD domain-containing protein n=2 Tax=Saccharolobus shibatae TaxID=2286 RepID=A0A8F5BVN6_9CREN|nr:hypothetical protein J5U21_01792 [Saccharolobus shibatae]
MCCAFFNKEEECIEPYLKHIYTASLIWDKIYSKYYLKSIRRVLKTKEDLVKMAILYHDLGKLTNEYKEGNRKNFRHELVGAYLAYKLLQNDYAFYVSLTVMLHHESGILGIYAGEKGESFITLSTLRKVIYNADLKIYCDLTVDDPWYDKAKTIFGKEIERVNKYLKTMDNKEMYEIIKEIIVRVSVGNATHLLEIRTKIASLLYPLTLVDSISAYYTRGDSKDSATWIASRALGTKEETRGPEETRAEIPKREEIEKVLRKEGIIT